MQSYNKVIKDIIYLINNNLKILQKLSSKLLILDYVLWKTAMKDVHLSGIRKLSSVSISSISDIKEKSE